MQGSKQNYIYREVRSFKAYIYREVNFILKYSVYREVRQISKKLNIQGSQGDFEIFSIQQSCTYREGNDILQYSVYREAQQIFNEHTGKSMISSNIEYTGK